METILIFKNIFHNIYLCIKENNYSFSHFLLEVHPSLVPIRPLASKIEERLETGIETWA